MSYKAELEAKYRAARRRMGLGVNAPVVKRVTGGVSGSTGVIPPASLAAPVKVIKHATAAAAAVPVQVLSKIQEAYEAEIEAMPRLPVIPDINSSAVGRWRRVLSAVAENHGLTPDEILSLSRRRIVTAARMECMYRMRTDLKMSLIAIGEKLGRDHSTVLHGIRVIHRRLLDATPTIGDDHGVLEVGFPPTSDTQTLHLVAA